MQINRHKVIKAVIIFLGIILLFTLISTKVDYWMTPEVQVAVAEAGELSFQIEATGSVNGRNIVFEIELRKDSYISERDIVLLTFENIKPNISAIVREKQFDADTQSMVCVCEIIGEGEYQIYDGQLCDVKYTYVVGSYEKILPRECIIQSGSDTFVYVVETVSGVFGEYDLVKKLSVAVLETDEFNAAVDAAINMQSQVVKNSSKPLDHEQKVRSSQ